MQVNNTSHHPPLHSHETTRKLSRHEHSDQTMDMNATTPEPTDVGANANAPTTLPKGQFLLTAENARPGLIVMAYVVDQQDDWAVAEHPVRDYVAPYDPDPFSEIGISGNEFDGVLLFGDGTEGNRVQGNFIGTDAIGSLGVANGGADIAQKG